MEADSLESEVSQEERQPLSVVAGCGKHEHGLPGEVIHEVREVAVLVLGGNEEVLLNELWGVEGGERASEVSGRTK